MQESRNGGEQAAMQGSTRASSAAPRPERSELVVTRIFAAPRELVFKAWTDPAHLRRWWGPKRFPGDRIAMEARVGAPWRNSLRSVETGELLWHNGVFKEVVPPERLVFTFRWEEEGERGLETVVTLTFAEDDGKTRMTLHQAPFTSLAERDGHGEGWNSAFDRLQEMLAAG
jgi:uncharacterized protein YndB with AHSA1/START domain